MRAKVSTVVTGSPRICVSQVCFDDIKLLLINAYLPFQDGITRKGEFTSKLSIIEDLIWPAS